MARVRRNRSALRLGSANDPDTAIRRYVLGEISGDACLRIICSDTAETAEARASRARVMQVYESTTKWLGR